MNDDEFLGDLPIERRLALSYARRKDRGWTAALFLLDARLAGIVRHTREQMLGQMRLAWWRERLSGPVQSAGSGDRLLDSLATWHRRDGLVALVDGWEALLMDQPLAEPAIDAFVRGRAEACRNLAGQLDCADSAPLAARAGAGWALAELASKLSDPAEVDCVQKIASTHAWQTIRLPRALRPIAVLHTLARRRQGQGPLLNGPTDLLLAARVGLFGR